MGLIKGMNYNLQCKMYNDKGKFGKGTNSGHNAMYHLNNATKSRPAPGPAAAQVA